MFIFLGVRERFTEIIKLDPSTGKLLVVKPIKPKHPMDIAVVRPLFDDSPIGVLQSEEQSGGIS